MHWFQQLPSYVQLILSLVMLDWLFFQCWYAQRVLRQAGKEEGL